ALVGGWIQRLDRGIADGADDTARLANVLESGDSLYAGVSDLQSRAGVAAGERGVNLGGIEGHLLEPIVFASDQPDERLVGHDSRRHVEGEGRIVGKVAGMCVVFL